MRLHHAIAVQLVLEDLLLDDVLTEFEQIDAVDEVVLWEVVAFTIADAFDCFHPMLLVLHDLFEAEKLVFAQNDQAQDFDIFDRVGVNTAIKCTYFAASWYLLKHHLTSGASWQALV